LGKQNSVTSFYSRNTPIKAIMAQRRSTADMLQSATLAGTAIQKQDRVVEAQSEQILSKPANMPLAKILDRATDTRDVKPEHVQELIESISILGLLEPLVVDIRGRLLAGAHRRSAITIIKEEDLESYTRLFPDDLVPVRVMDFDAEQDPNLALQIEISENEKRRDYTPSEVRSLAEKLKEAGYEDVKGRPARGERALRPALEVIIGKSIRTIRRYLNTTSEKSVTDVRLSQVENETIALKRLRTELTRWQRSCPEPHTEELTAMDKDISKLIRRVNRVLTDRESKAEDF
jgi:ParB family transcriptional regulator, chromosome partitioning protein